MVSRWLVLASLVLAVPVLVACGRGEERGDQVAVIENGVTLGTVPRRQAVEDVSSRVKFEVRLPTYVPSGGFELQAIEATLPNPVEAEGQDGKSNAVSTSIWVADADDEHRTVLELLQFSRPLEPAAVSEPADSGDEDADLFIERGDEGVIFTWNLSEEGFQLIATGANVPEDDELLRMLRSLD